MTLGSKECMCMFEREKEHERGMCVRERQRQKVWSRLVLLKFDSLSSRLVYRKNYFQLLAVLS